jgi:hypothetical protein
VDPGRSVDNFWMGNPLFFDLVPLVRETNGPPWMLIIAAVAAVGVVVAAVVLLKMRGKKKEEKISESPLGD